MSKSCLLYEIFSFAKYKKSTPNDVDNIDIIYSKDIGIILYFVSRYVQIAYVSSSNQTNFAS